MLNNKSIFSNGELVLMVNERIDHLAKLLNCKQSQISKITDRGENTNIYENVKRIQKWETTSKADTYSKKELTDIINFLDERFREESFKLKH